MGKFELDKANKQQLIEILRQLENRNDLAADGRAMMREAADVIGYMFAWDVNPNDFWSIVHYKTVKGEIEMNIDESDVEADEYHFCSGCGESGACYCTSDEDE